MSIDTFYSGTHILFIEVTPTKKRNVGAIDVDQVLEALSPVSTGAIQDAKKRLSKNEYAIFFDKVKNQKRFPVGIELVKILANGHEV